ncbi:hypothetical protein TNCV_894511 [Trichonephila clavipes]|nr:hypothetical protein TNCV_894511 [Trichonephila clavipes]
MSKAVIHYRERKLLNVSEKAGKASTNAQDVCRLAAPLKTSKRFLRQNEVRDVGIISGIFVLKFKYYRNLDKIRFIRIKFNNENDGMVIADCCVVGLGSNPREDMDVCKCIVPPRQGGILKNRRAANPRVRLEEEERCEASDHPRVYSLKIGVKPS